MRLSLIIPVFNRPDEIDELLDSLVRQSVSPFEIIVVEDGSSVRCEDIVGNYSEILPNLYYYYIPNGGPGQARNYGAARATGDFFIVLDSDCIIPPDYILSVTNELKATGADAFGGPDRASDNFTNIQKAINYSMTSFFTTGGIRGGKRELDKFYPRSFNMGISRAAYEHLGGFSRMRFGEDIDFSIRLYEAGFNVRLFSSAWVYHKRRTGWRKFFRQVFNSGIARINLYRKYPRSLKAVHLLPAAFTAGVLACLLASPFCIWSLSPIILYMVIVMADAGCRNRSLKIGILSVVSSFVQLTGYGMGFISAAWNRIILRKGEFSAFEKTFYK
jgi:glycosyltransferase involved in cell wall biosynthesis